MAAVSKLDPNLAKELWLNGFSVTDISKKVGVKPVTIYSWKRKHKWDCEPRIKHPSEHAGIQAVMERVTTTTLRVCEQIINRVDNAPLTALRDCKEAATAIAAAYATARKASGQDDQAGSGRVNVTVYQGSVLVSSEPDRKAIDVTCEPSENQAQVVDNVQVNPETALIDIVRKPTQAVD